MSPTILLNSSLLPTRPADLPGAVRQAVAFEHAIIPLYLYALYSLDEGRNGRIAALLHSIVRDEMLHMILACNVLNALGHAPDLQSPDFPMKYPGPLPGTLAAGMTVSLAPFSLKQVRSVFMRIERPNHPLRFRTVPQWFSEGITFSTIGQFYGAIKDQVKSGGDALFTGNPLHQVVDPRMPELIPVVDAASACDAIDIIVEQGEGTTKKPLGPEGDYAHYYKFQQIAKLRRLVPNRRAGAATPASRRYQFAPRIPFDPKGVRAVPTNPKAADYAPGTKARRACDQFNYTYTALLRTLHAVVNGRPQELVAAFGLMFSLKHQAFEMMTGKSTDGVPTGPSFEYQRTAPA